MGDASGEWPVLPYSEWRATRDTLHMYAQVIGKLRLALSPFEPELDLHDHVLLLRTNDGQVERRPIGGAVADFYRDVMDGLRRMGIDVGISVMPSEVPDPIPFPEDRTHATYVPEQAARFHRVLSMVDLVMKEHRAQFRGRT